MNLQIYSGHIETTSKRFHRKSPASRIRLHQETFELIFKFSKSVQH